MQAHQALEAEFAAWIGYAPEQVVACASGSAALHLALEALQLPQGSEVVTSDFNMIAVPRAIALAGLVPVFVDCDERLLMDTRHLNSFFGDVRSADGAASAIVVTHIYGRAVSMCSVSDTMVRVAPAIIEDLAEAHGVRPHPETDAACWSFYRNKIIHGEEGGIVAFKDPAHATRARSLRSLGFTDAHDFNHIPRGMNYRMSNPHAQLIRYSLAHADRNLERRREIEALYDAHCPAQWRMPSRAVCWVYDLRIPGMTHEMQTRVVKALQEVGIQARHAFRPMSSQEEFRYCHVIGNGNTARLAREVLYLPCAPDSPPDASRAFDIIKSIVLPR